MDTIALIASDDTIDRASPDGGALFETPGRSHGRTGLFLCPLYGRLGDSRPNPVERRAIVATNQVMASLKVEKRLIRLLSGASIRDSILWVIGFCRRGWQWRQKPWREWWRKCSGNTEQNASPVRIAAYLRNWLRWVMTGVNLVGGVGENVDIRSFSLQLPPQASRLW
ncbi:MAG: hypothetical protein F6J93_34795 [Oscillatoria sp. SIO1A7]|nr:hypothetical protein [Oscillatoria sp. SIO1A7]